MTDRPFGFDTLAIPVYLAKGDDADDPGLARWKAEHPDWFEAGTWTPAPRSRPVPPRFGRERPAMAPDKIAELATAPLPSLNPSTLSVADFERIADMSRAPPPEPVPAPLPPAPSDLAYPEILPPEVMKKKDVQSSTGFVFHLPNGKPVPDLSRTEPIQEQKLLSPTGFIMTPFPDSAPDVAKSGRRAGLALAQHFEVYAPDMPLSMTQSQGAANFIVLLGLAVGQGETYGYQRDGNHLFGFRQHPQSRAISNFNVGLFCQQAGLTLEETLGIAGQYASVFSRNVDKQDTNNLSRYMRDFIEQGWKAGENGIYGPESEIK